MIPGPLYIYKCPKCSKLIERKTLESGNTFGSRMFSDGKRIAPMLPEFPNLTKCMRCGTIMWLSKMKETEIYSWGSRRPFFGERSYEAEFLDIDDYFRALYEGHAENMKEELYIRQQIWWAYNDRTRKGENIFDDKNDEIK